MHTFDQTRLYCQWFRRSIVLWDPNVDFNYCIFEMTWLLLKRFETKTTKLFLCNSRTFHVKKF